MWALINSKERKKIVVELEQKATSILERIGEKKDPVLKLGDASRFLNPETFPGFIKKLKKITGR